MTYIQDQTISLEVGWVNPEAFIKDLYSAQSITGRSQTEDGPVIWSLPGRHGVLPFVLTCTNPALVKTQCLLTVTGTVFHNGEADVTPLGQPRIAVRVNAALQFALVCCFCLWLGWNPGSAVAAAWVDPVGPPPAIELGAQAYAEQHYTAALAQFSQGIAEAASPDQMALAYGNRCLVQLQLEHYPAALEDCTAALQLQPEDIEARLNLGVAYHRLGQYTAALRQFQQLLLLRASDYRAHYNQALSFSALGDQPQAIASHTKALETATRTAKTSVQALIYRDRGVAYLLQANYGAAIADFDQALERDPADLEARFNRGCACHRNGQMGEAIAEFSRVIEQDSHHPQARFNRGLLQAQRGHRQAAMADLQEALKGFEQAQDRAQVERTQALLRRLQAQPQTQPTTVVTALA